MNLAKEMQGGGESPLIRLALQIHQAEQHYRKVAMILPSLQMVLDHQPPKHCCPSLKILQQVLQLPFLALVAE